MYANIRIFHSVKTFDAELRCGKKEANYVNAKN
jgi:hypothetical protein